MGEGLPQFKASAKILHGPAGIIYPLAYCIRVIWVGVPILICAINTYALGFVIEVKDGTVTIDVVPPVLVRRAINTQSIAVTTAVGNKGDIVVIPYTVWSSP